jgi:type I restriction enzyme S subunit
VHRYSQTYNEKGLAQSKLWSPGTLCITIAANIAETAILGIEACFPDSVVGFVADPSNCDARFIKYYIDTIKLQMQSVSMGTTQDNLSLGKLLTFDFLTPPLRTQRKIAAVLSAYDDLIENNTRRIRILEEMARAIYCEWFVHFRFPGREKVRMVESEIGPVPEGWSRGQFSDIAQLLRNNIRPMKYKDELFEHFSFPAFDNGCMPVLERGEEIRSNKYLVERGTVLLSKLNPRIPRIWLPFPGADYRPIASTEFLVLKPRIPFTSVSLFGLCGSQSFVDEFAALSGGTSTSHQRVKPSVLLAMPIVVPQRSVLDTFNRIVSLMIKLAQNLRVKNANLRHTRNLLLPRLVSGGLDVSELDIDTGWLDARVSLTLDRMRDSYRTI